MRRGLSEFLKRLGLNEGPSILPHKSLNFSPTYTYLRATLLQSCNMQAEKISGSASARISILEGPCALKGERLVLGSFGVCLGFGFCCLFWFFNMTFHCPGPPEASQPSQKAEHITPGCSTALMWPLNPG